MSFWGSGTSSGALSLAIFLPAIIFYVGSLPAYRVLMVWVYDRTGESISGDAHARGFLSQHADPAAWG